MKSIFASKLYRASSRKDRIQAALLSPSNLALVQQLADSLDEEYQTPENLGIDVHEQEEQNDQDFMVDEEVNPETDLVTMDDLADSMKGGSPHSSAPSHSSSSSGSEPSEGLEEKPESDNSELMPDSPMTDESDNSSSNKVTKVEKQGEPAEASTKVTASTVCDLNILKSTLNNREDLAGVNRIAEKDNEVWIYYKDEINLNNIMTDVIEFLMNTKEYESFEFNRLARSDNAIVFDVILESHQYPDRNIADNNE